MAVLMSDTSMFRADHIIIVVENLDFDVNPSRSERVLLKFCFPDIVIVAVRWKPISRCFCTDSDKTFI